MPDTAVNILWTIIVGTFVLLMLAVGFIMAIVQSKRREIIAKQREMEELSKREAKYRNLFENSLAGMLRLDATTWDVLDANPALLNMFGLQSISEVREIIESISIKDRDYLQSVIADFNKVSNYHITLKRKDGTEICVSFSGSFFPDEKILECILIDITEQKRLEVKQLQTHRMESIGVLASGIAHDLKNLLVPVKLAVEMLKQKIPDAQIQKTLNSIGDYSEHSINLTQQVLSFVRGAEGNHKPLQASELLRSVLYAVQETMPDNIEVKNSILNVSTMILGEATQLRQVLVNLFNNAKDAMPNGGCISVSQQEIIIDKVMVEIIPNASEGHFIVWSISDTGIGISSDKIGRVFEPFYTTKEISKGTGLGLSIVAGIVKGHKGFFKVESELDKGTTFHIYLPTIQHF